LSIVERCAEISVLVNFKYDITTVDGYDVYYTRYNTLLDIEI